MDAKLEVINRRSDCNMKINEVCEFMKYIPKNRRARISVFLLDTAILFCIFLCAEMWYSIIETFNLGELLFFVLCTLSISFICAAIYLWCCLLPGSWILKKFKLNKPPYYLFMGMVFGIIISVITFYLIEVIAKGWRGFTFCMFLVIPAVLIVIDFLTYWYIAVREPKNNIEQSEKNTK